MQMTCHFCHFWLFSAVLSEDPIRERRRSVIPAEDILALTADTQAYRADGAAELALANARPLEFGGGSPMGSVIDRFPTLNTTMPYNPHHRWRRLTPTPSATRQAARAYARERLWVIEAHAPRGGPLADSPQGAAGAEEAARIS